MAETIPRPLVFKLLSLKYRHLKNPDPEAKKLVWLAAKAPAPSVRQPAKWYGGQHADALHDDGQEADDCLSWELHSVAMLSSTRSPSNLTFLHVRNPSTAPLWWQSLQKARGPNNEVSLKATSLLSEVVSVIPSKVWGLSSLQGISSLTAQLQDAAERLWFLEADHETNVCYGVCVASLELCLYCAAWLL